MNNRQLSDLTIRIIADRPMNGKKVDSEFYNHSYHDSKAMRAYKSKFRVAVRVVQAMNILRAGGSVIAVQKHTLSPEPKEFPEEKYFFKEEPMGEGGNGAVYRARDQESGDLVAMKIIVSRSRGRRSSAGFARLLEKVAKEVSISRRLQEGPENLQRLVAQTTHFYKYEPLKEAVLIIRPFADGGTLAARIKDQLTQDSTDGVREYIDEDFFHLALSDLANGLNFIHQHSVRHKDIKPSNILIHQGRLLYADFGISTEWDPRYSKAGTTASTRPQYTYEYAAPEILSRKAPRNKQADIFNLGAVFLELLSCRAMVTLQDPGMKELTPYADGPFVGYGDDLLHNGSDNGAAKRLEFILSNDKLRELDENAELTALMMELKPERRPTAAEICERVMELKPFD
ncbi:kinase-like protein [Corynespora cassiicola Philippines]|uniref:Kinase-like protein n=1 Tax=Corynespora cassiicola Philippines TaxID=1448308 RepID=A0A2T2NK01_CORCC|nr:kinase-like protein [Corynespora cassiicola Philippines]